VTTYSDEHQTQYATATGCRNEPGPLRRIVMDFCDAKEGVLARGVKSPEDWAPMAAFLDVASFKRVGAYLEELDYEQYCAFLTGWAAGGTRFEMTEFHVTEVGDALFQ